MIWIKRGARLQTTASCSMLAALVLAIIHDAAAQDQAVEPAVLSVRPPRGSASIPGLRPLKPTPVPGVGQLLRAYSPCLSADLKTIVFANWKSRETEYDLYIAKRAVVDQPFGPAERIEACVTRWTDASPALSADGLELIYVSSDDAHPATAPKLLRARRSQAKDEFSAPEELVLPGVDALQQRVSNPQFLDKHGLKFCLIESQAVRTVRLAGRADAEEPFKTAEMLPVDNPWPQWWISGDGLRAYASVEEGIGMAFREATSKPFGPMQIAIPAKVIGKTDGPIWLAPQEDAIFYCAPGEQGRPDAGRHLMMIAF